MERLQGGDLFQVILHFFYPFFGNFLWPEKYDVFVFPQTIAKSKFHLTEAKCVVVIGQVGSFKLFQVKIPIKDVQII